MLSKLFSSAKHSGLQKEVLALYRTLLRATRGNSSTREHVRQQFRDHQHIPRNNIVRIEFLLRKGRRDVELLRLPGTTRVSTVKL